MSDNKRLRELEEKEKEYYGVVKKANVGMQTWQALLNQMQDDEESRKVIAPFVTKWHDMIITDMNMLNTMMEIQEQNKKARGALLTMLANPRAVDRMLGVKVPGDEEEK